MPCPSTRLCSHVAVGNGGKTENYEWTQTLQELSVVVPVPPGSKSRDVVCDISKSSLKVGVKGQPLLLDVSLIFFSTAAQVLFIHCVFFYGNHRKNKVE